jgi:hypothetical protein
MAQPAGAVRKAVGSTSPVTMERYAYACRYHTGDGKAAPTYVLGGQGNALSVIEIHLAYFRRRYLASIGANV